MKITLSKSQWQKIGQEAGWIVRTDNQMLNFFVKRLGSVKGNGLYKDVQAEIDKLNVNVVFEEDINVIGLANRDACILSSKIFGYNKVVYVLTAVFHELAHYYQYRKYGKDFAMRLLDQNIDINKAANGLKRIEEIADKFSLYKTNFYMRKYNLPDGFRPSYRGMPLSTIIRSIEEMRQVIRDNKLTTIEEIDELFYNSIQRFKDKIPETPDTSYNAETVKIENQEIEETEEN